MRSRFFAYRIVHLGVLIVCLTRVIAYSPFLGGPYESSGPMFLTNDGRIMWLYIALWAIGSLLALWGIMRGRGVLPILWFVFLMLTWSGGYLGAWVTYEGQRAGRAWMSFFLYGGNAVVALGVYYLVQALDKKRHEENVDTHKILMEDRGRE
ncbi:hypothetical protein [Kocuria massiliensis]|uniref:hypothetical protein n=1 Tax=Kocuria massiliensis TaxID=1926282 RepID=UPI0022B98568|nr:hypothetical protein [Kocuria massiliensis]